ncbi:hypothetical protein SLS64_008717 [Diaporthe eres]
MCVIIHYLCQNCKKETGQRDYVSHTDGQRFTIPDPKMKVVSFCPDIRPYRAVLHDPSVQSPGFRCMNPLCSDVKIKFNAKKCQKQDAKILARLRDTEYKVTLEGQSCTDVKKMLESKGLDKADIQKLPGARLQKWNLYTEDKLKKMAANGDSYEDMKMALKAITGLNYITYEIIAKAASLKLYESLFPLEQARHRDREVPRFLFRGFNKRSGGNSDLNTPIAITPHAFYGIPKDTQDDSWIGSTIRATFGPRRQFDPPKPVRLQAMSYSRLRKEVCGHLAGNRKTNSHFSSWTADLQTAMNFAKGGPSPHIGVLDTQSRHDDNIIMHVLALWEAGLSNWKYPEEYLVPQPEPFSLMDYFWPPNSDQQRKTNELEAIGDSEKRNKEVKK